jgi:hypothetical protein
VRDGDAATATVATVLLDRVPDAGVLATAAQYRVAGTLRGVWGS